jgi:legumain
LALLSAVQAANWAVLVAGSEGFSNYRHQSDIFRTYRILTKNGFDPSKIIVFAYDDVANHRSNPFPGKVYNVPDGPDVYIGSDKIDYKGANCTAAKFYAVLLGDAAKAGGKVLQSTSEDNVFVFYNDHGSSGLICFPVGGYAYADEMSRVMTQMYQKNMYKKFLFYVEACYAGSMFQKYLTNNTNVYGMTAANERESSYAEYCGIAKYKTCLSNEFSQRWMEHSDANDLTTITVDEQFVHTRAATKMSHVMNYGDLTIGNMKVSEFQGGPFPRDTTPRWVRPPTSGQNPLWTQVSQTEAHLFSLRAAAEGDKFGPAAIEYHNELVKKRKEEGKITSLDTFFGMGSVVSEDYDVTKDMALFKHAVETYEKHCGRLNEYTTWEITFLLTRAINHDKLTVSNFDAFVSKLRQLA